jgi:hypothetical protein
MRTLSHRNNPVSVRADINLFSAAAAPLAEARALAEEVAPQALELVEALPAAAAATD